ncbi:Uma2 family endonuclease [Thermoleptolyngbya sichuanensis A183]|uniref:Uma2 family endonuclease n=2 Tax=Thermoleptolyngbya TaxID=2303528 RepID=A0A6M8BF55_9CYAN|nr:Uma2 family endonuclease [Thermoleptolyngbya sichuanensis A183]
MAMVSSFQPALNAEDQRVLLSGVTWQQYDSLLATLGDYPGLRLIYLEGTLEIFMPSAEHELVKKVLARLIERYAEAVDIPLHGYGSTTFRQEAAARGLEPDECCCINTLKPLPDFAIEVNLSSGGINKLAVYQGLGVPEVLVWQAGDLTLYDLRGKAYRTVSHSQFFPNLEIQQLAQFVRPYDQPQAIKDFLSSL